MPLLTEPLTRVRVDRDTLRLEGPLGAIQCWCTRLPSGHAYVEVVLQPSHGTPGILTRRASQPLREAWDRGGEIALFVALEDAYARLLPEAA